MLPCTLCCTRAATPTIGRPPFLHHSRHIVPHSTALFDCNPPPPPSFRRHHGRRRRQLREEANEEAFLQKKGMAAVARLVAHGGAATARVAGARGVPAESSRRALADAEKAAAIVKQVVPAHVI